MSMTARAISIAALIAIFSNGCSTTPQGAREEVVHTELLKKLATQKLATHIALAEHEESLRKLKAEIWRLNQLYRSQRQEDGQKLAEEMCEYIDSALQRLSQNTNSSKIKETLEKPSN